MFACVKQSYKINQWYDLFMPDGWEQKKYDSVRKFTYDIGVKYSNETGKFSNNEFEAKVLFGPSSPGQKETKYLPVKFTEPYFDCGRSDRWIISAVAPIVDQVPRYLDWFHLRRETWVWNSLVAFSIFHVRFATGKAVVMCTFCLHQRFMRLPPDSISKGVNVLAVSFVH